MNITQRKERWVKAFLEAGHEFVMEEPDYEGETPQINWFVTYSDSWPYHYGPACAKCGWAECYECTSIDFIPQCHAA